MLANANAMTTVGKRSLEALRLQPLGKPPQVYRHIYQQLVGKRRATIGGKRKPIGGKKRFERD